MKSTKIEWTDKTWNPVTGCTKISLGCINCYAEQMACRLKSMGVKKYENAFKVTEHPESLGEPIKWKSPCMIFVCSMSDLFHSEIPFSYIDKVFDVIRLTPQHTYQVLTKRPERMSEYFANRDVPANVWLGVTVEDERVKDRIDSLRCIPARVRFLSCEPLLSNLGKLNLDGINWVIVGGESGKNARKMEEQWVLAIKEQAEEQGSSFFFKQWGVWGCDGKRRSKKANGAMLQGKIVQDMPN